MSLIVTFLGKGGTGRTTIAIATAKKLAANGRKVLLVGQDSSPAYSLSLGVNLTKSKEASPIQGDISSIGEPQEIGVNLSVVQLKTTTLLEQSWEQAKKLEQQYLRSPILKNVYGQELGILPGMDEALALNALREYDGSRIYDAIVYDGSGDVRTLRMLGMPEILSWYVRRFRGVFAESDIVKALSPFVQPVTSAILNVSWTPDNLTSEPTNEASQMLERGKEALNNPQRVIAYLVTTRDELAVAMAKYLWGGAQQIGLTVGGVLVNQDSNTIGINEDFNPLRISSLPTINKGNWQPLMDALPSFNAAPEIPQPTTIDIATSKIKVFLPGFDKKQVKLTQYGPEITIEAGDQRRNITLPPQWSGRSVTGAKFNNSYLELSIG